MVTSPQTGNMQKVSVHCCTHTGARLILGLEYLVLWLEARCAGWCAVPRRGPGPHARGAQARVLSLLSVLETSLKIRTKELSRLHPTSVTEILHP